MRRNERAEPSASDEDDAESTTDDQETGRQRASDGVGPSREAPAGSRRGVHDDSPSGRGRRTAGILAWLVALPVAGAGALGTGYSLGYLVGSVGAIAGRLLTGSLPLAVSLALLVAGAGLASGRFHGGYREVALGVGVGAIAGIAALGWSRGADPPSGTWTGFELLLTVGVGALAGVVLSLYRSRGRRIGDLERYRSVVESTGGGAFAVDGDGTVTMVTPGLADLVRVDRESMVGTDAGELGDRLLPESGAGTDTAVDSLASLVDREPVELTVTPADRGPVTFELEVARGPDGDGIVGTVRDVSRYERLRQGLSVTNRVLRHNLRTSTNLIAGQARMVEVDAGDEGTAQRARTARREAERLSDLAEDARLLGEIAEDGFESRPVDVDPADLVEEAVEMVRADHERASYSVEAPTGLTVRAHPQIALAIAEAVENAVVHAGSPAPSVAVTVDPGEDFHEIRIADEGPGIPHHERTVLDRHAESELDHGSGLGLWLIRWLVDLSTGELQFEDPDSAGSVVVIRLPAVDGRSTR